VYCGFQYRLPGELLCIRGGPDWIMKMETCPRDRGVGLKMLLLIYSFKFRSTF